MRKRHLYKYSFVKMRQKRKMTVDSTMTVFSTFSFSLLAGVQQLSITPKITLSMRIAFFLFNSMNYSHNLTSKTTAEDILRKFLATFSQNFKKLSLVWVGNSVNRTVILLY